MNKIVNKFDQTDTKSFFNLTRSVFHSENITLGGILLLAFFVLSSKHIIIYNEESLILLCFVGFLFFSVYMAGESIQKSFDDRSNAIYAELQNSLYLKECLFIELIKEHKKYLFLNTLLIGKENSPTNSIPTRDGKPSRVDLSQSKIAQKSSLSLFSFQELLTIRSQRQKALQNLLSNHILQKLNGLFYLQFNLQNTIQQSILNGFRGSVLEEFQFSKKILQPKLIEQALFILRNKGLLRSQ